VVYHCNGFFYQNTSFITHKVLTQKKNVDFWVSPRYCNRNILNREAADWTGK